MTTSKPRSNRKSNAKQNNAKTQPNATHSNTINDDNNFAMDSDYW